MRHRKDECVGNWQLMGDTRNPSVERTSIVCDRCGARYRYSLQRHGESVMENLWGIQALNLTREGQVLLDRKKEANG